MTIQTLLRIAQNPSYITAIVDPDIAVLGVKVGLLVVALLYLIVCFIIFVQTRRLESWLLSLGKYRFSRLVLIQLSSILIGMVMVFFLL